jgi:para-aminobenzoate synthetase component 1
MGFPLPDPTPVFCPSRPDYARLGVPAPVGAWVPLAGRHPHDLLERLAPAALPFLLESARPGGASARWSFLGGDPVFTVRADGEGVHVLPGPSAPASEGPLRTLRNLLAPWRVLRPDGFPPFFGGFVGLLSYDLGRRFERLPVHALDDLAVPDLDLSFVDTVVTWLPDPASRAALRAEALHDRGRERIAAVFARLARPAPARPERPAPVVGEPRPGVSRDRFLAMVHRAKDYIAAGDIFQANLSQRFACPVSGLDPWSLYRTLTGINPSPFACYLDRGGHQVVSSSPERLAAVDGRRVQARPIAGTRPRGADATGDRARGAEMLASPKERAEHVMLVDLMRNDLGRVCDYGSVRVTEFMATERYSHVMHIVSNVEGVLGPGKDALAVVRAVFPGGTITGAPKVRCMEIIEELEPVRRGLYTGSAGYLSAAGDMDLNILIRTIVLKAGRAFFQTGAGIVADSDPAFEHQETLHKAEAMRRALAAVAAPSPTPALAAAQSA